MAEKHIYSEDFFKFLNDLFKTLKYPSDYDKVITITNPNNVVFTIYPEYE